MTTPSAGASAGFFDARPLVDPVDRREVEAFSRANRAHDNSGSEVLGWVLVIVMLILFVMPITGLALMAAGKALFDVGGIIVGLVLAFLLTGGIIAGGIALMARSVAARRLARFRLWRFAAANSMEFVDSVEAPPLPGMLFSYGTRRRSTHVLRGRTPRFVEFGNYQYTTSSGKNSQTHHWGYVAVKLDVPLPHIVLDARGDNAIGGTLPLGLTRDQRLSLEGDFDRYFSLYCPSGYETDALYLFTPDVMARFIDNAAELDVEIVDDWMLLYTRRPVSTLDPATWAWVFGAVGALLTKLDQWARWRDDRLRGLSSAAVHGASAPAIPAVPTLPPSTTAPAAPSIPAPPSLPFAVPAGLLTPPPIGVAPPGQRLRRRSPWLMFAIVLGVLVGFMLLPMVFGWILLLVQH